LILPEIAWQPKKHLQQIAGIADIARHRRNRKGKTYHGDAEARRTAKVGGSERQNATTDGCAMIRDQNRERSF